MCVCCVFLLCVCVLCACMRACAYVCNCACVCFFVVVDTSIILISINREGMFGNLYF